MAVVNADTAIFRGSAVPCHGTDAVCAALERLNRGQKLSETVSGALTRAFGRHLLVRALMLVECGTMHLANPMDKLYLCAPNPEVLAKVCNLFTDQWTEAVRNFETPPTTLIQHPDTFGPRLAATPTASLAFIQFPLYPMEGASEARSAARHEVCHAFCWSGRRYLDEGLADCYAGNIGSMERGDRRGPSTRSLIEAENGSDLHFEQQADGAIAAQRLRRRGAFFAGELVKRLGWIGTRELCNRSLCLPGNAVAETLEAVLQCSLEEWDQAHRDDLGDPLEQARALIARLSMANQRPALTDLQELNGLVRDVRRNGETRTTVAELLAAKEKIGRAETKSRVVAIQQNARNVRLNHVVEGKRRSAEKKPPNEQGGLAISLGETCVHGDTGPRLHIDGFKISAGEHVGIIGANGSGKSTLLSLFASPETAGLVIDQVAAGQWFKSPSNRRRLGVALAEFPYHPYSRVRELIRLHEVIYGPPVPQIRDMFDMKDHSMTRICDLSKGWKQTLCLYFTFAHDPDLVLLDEPTTGLDDEHKKAVHTLLGDPNRNRTIIVASHVGADLENVNRVIVLKEGKTVTDASKNVLLTAYGEHKAYVLEPEASEFAGELRSLDGLRGSSHDVTGLTLFGDAAFAIRFVDLAVQLNLTAFGLQPTSLDDLISRIAQTRS